LDTRSQPLLERRRRDASLLARRRDVACKSLLRRTRPGAGFDVRTSL